MQAIFITFPGNCRSALGYYQSCFGGKLDFDTLEHTALSEMPVISGSLISDKVVIYGSDLVSDEGRRVGNSMAIFLRCTSRKEREWLIARLSAGNYRPEYYGREDPLVELTDAFEVRWILAV